MILIDTHFDEEFADALAQLESYNKHLYRPNTYLHKWWARRCGSTFRLILKALTEDEAARDYYTPGGLAGKLILDPMMGGGTTLHEAIRLGANVIGADIDPIPVLQARATLREGRLADLAGAFDQFYRSLRARLAEFYQTTCPHCAEGVGLWFTLYGQRRRCPCGESLLVDSLTLRHLPEGAAVSLHPLTHDICYDDGRLLAGTGDTRPLCERKEQICPGCNERFAELLDVPYYQRYVPLALAGRCPQHGLFFTPPRPADLDLLAQADARRPHLALNPADFVVEPGAKSQSLLDHGIGSYLDLFSSRQLLYLATAVSLLNREPLAVSHEPSQRNTEHGTRNTDLPRLNLALLVSTSLEFNSLLCGYKGYGQKTARPGSIRHAFTYHAYSFPYTALENNPLYGRRASGNLQNLFESRVIRGRVWAKAPIERRPSPHGQPEKVTIEGEVDTGQEVDSLAELQSGARRFWLRQGSSAALDLPDGCVDFIVSDPPYFDSVQYSDLAAYFRVWLRQLLPEAADWAYRPGEAAVEPATNGDGAEYTAVLSQIFAECARVLKKDNGRFIFTYHHWNPKGWAAITLALKRAGFGLVNRYVVHAENLASRHIVGQKALVHDVILVCAPAEQVAREWEAITAVALTNSYQFCYDCGSVLGWLLHSDLNEAAIEAAWHDLLTQKN
jgi:putative DNA methylase